MYWFKLSILSIISIVPFTYAQCYLADGRLEQSADFLPCPDMPTICCALNRKNFPGGNITKDGFTRDECMPNGLCQNRAKLDNGKDEKTWWRDSCADRDWKSGNCLNVCTAGEGGNVRMTPCDGTATSKKWCCGTNTDCCNTEFTITLDAKFKATGPAIQSSVSSSSTSSARTTTATSASSSSTAASSSTTNTASSSKSTSDPGENLASNQTAKSDDLSTGAKVGIAIGAIIGALVCFGLGFFVAKLPQRSSKGGATQLPSYAEHRVAPVEMAVHPHEMHGGYAGAELGSHGYGTKTPSR